MAENFEQLSDALTNALDVTFRRDYMSSTEYMQHYTGVYNFCNTHRLNDIGALHLVEMMANIQGRLHQFVEEYVTNHVANIYRNGESMHGTDILWYFTTEWENYQFSSKVLNGVFAPLNRNWVESQIDRGRGYFNEIYTLALVIWKRELFDKLENEMIAAMLELINSERNGSNINRRHISGIIEYLIELGSALSASEEEFRTETNKFDVYKQCFETEFLESTKIFYTSESIQLLANGENVADYMMNVEKRLQEEEDRVQLYLHSTTQTALTRCCKATLIFDQLEFLESSFERLLVEKKNEDMARMYKLCSQVENALDGLRRLFEEHIKKDGNEALEQIRLEINTDPKLYAMTLLGVHERYETLVSHLFNNDPRFMESLDDAAVAIFNRNAVTGLFPTQIQYTKSSELLAQCCDQIVQSSMKNHDESILEGNQKMIMICMRYLEDKDVFCKFYSYMLSKRLIHDSSVSEDVEENFIASLYKACGYEFTSCLSKMFRDAQVSKELTSEFEMKQPNLLGQNNVDHHFHVLTAISWPEFNNIIITIPQHLSSTIEEFEKFYNEKFNGRRLSWVHSQSRGELTSSIFYKNYVFIATAAQVCTILLFNDETSYNVHQISKDTGMNVETTSRIVGSLIKSRLLNADTAINNNKVQMDDRVSLNYSYINTRVRVDLSEFEQDDVGEIEKLRRNIEDDRKTQINACIMRTLKNRRHVGHEELLTEVKFQLSRRFQPQIETIEICIGSLIEEDFMIRVDGWATYEIVSQT